MPYRHEAETVGNIGIFSGKDRIKMEERKNGNGN
jgi:hypothetical protein